MDVWCQRLERRVPLREMVCCPLVAGYLWQARSICVCMGRIEALDGTLMDVNVHGVVSLDG